MPKPVLAVAASITGSLMMAQIRAGVPHVCVFSDRECAAVEKARVAGKEVHVLPRSLKKSEFTQEARRTYTLAAKRLLLKRGVSHLIMAGFMTVFDEVMFDDSVEGPIELWNSHPSLFNLLTQRAIFPGDKAVQDALKDPELTETGSTIHLATSRLDQGPIKATAIIPIPQAYRGCTDPQLIQKFWNNNIKTVEAHLYLAAIRTIPGLEWN